jgi:ribosome-binding factor A
VQRVESELLEILTQFLLHEINEPMPCYASITAVETHGDLRHAKVFFRLVGDPASVQDGERIL